MEIIPKPIIDSVSEIKTGQGEGVKALLFVLLFSGVGLVSAVVYLSKNNDQNLKLQNEILEKENQRLRDNNSSLVRGIEKRDSIMAAQNLYILTGVEEDKKRLIRRSASFDSAIQALQYANEKLRQKSR